MVMPRVGKFFISLLLFIVLGIQGKVTLSMRGMRGEKLQKVGIGVPFNLEVAIDGTQKDFNTPEIPSPIGKLQRTGFRMETLNGASRTTYIYAARIDKPGIYTFGPAIVKGAGGVEESELLEIEIAEQTVVQGQRRRSAQQDEAAIARLTISSDKAVVGEKLYATLRFYRLQPTVEFLSVAEPEEQKERGYIIKNKKDAVVGREEIEGVIADYIEWRWELYPNKTGEIVIPAYRVDYTVLPDRYDFFSTLFGARVAKTIYSNAVKIKIDPLPPYQGHVDGIGHIKSMSSQLHPAVLREGEGATLTITIDGDIDVEQFPLRNMPESIKVYESKKYRDNQKQCFEYVVQATGAGEFEIPSQQITYFDVDQYRYKKMATAPVPFTILKSERPQTMVPDEEQTEKEVVKSTTTSRPEIKGLMRHFYGAHGRTTHIPWYLFFIVCLIPVLFILKNNATILRNLLDNRLPGIQRRRALYNARRQLLKARAVNASARLYPLFISLFAALLKREPSQVTGIAIEQWMGARATAQELQSWQHFFTTLNQAQFFSAKTVDHQIFDEAAQWLSFIGKKA